ncbi:MAG: Hsp20/alpha crystallin family protein [Anaerolineales bacterium]|nr:Hsp20/alpha crystallin family protein [Anaerolineales bacterium]
MMNYLVRWDPYREMMNLRNAFDRYFDPSQSSGEAGWQPMTWNLALDVAETDDEYRVSASLPGIDPDDLEITYDSNVLTIKGEMREDQEVKEERYHMRERRYGSFSRSISLPTSVKADKIKADYSKGVLTLHLPKSEEARPKRIKVQSGEPKKMIEGKVASVSKN